MRNQIIDESLSPETLCTEEFLKASTAGPAGGTRPGSRPAARPRASAPGQAVRARGPPGMARGPPGMARPGGFRPMTPRGITPIRAPIVRPKQ